MAVAGPFTLTEEQLVWLSATFADAREAVWVFDGQNQLIYRNLRAETPAPDMTKTRYPVIDHTGVTIAHLVTESP
jgi:hypothetical protein